MFPVAISFGGVLLTILIGLHVVLMSVGRTAAQAAADRGVTAAQAAPAVGPGCGEFTRGGRTVRTENPRQCEGGSDERANLERRVRASKARRDSPRDVDEPSTG